jgi:hypothetical protein
MCTVILLCRPGEPWPLLLAANRDERLDRPADPPGAHWPGHPGVLAGRDRLADGTWLALGPGDVIAAVLNRPGSLGPAPGLRSRGELPLLAAMQPGAAAAAAEIARLEAGLWRDFNMVVADRSSAWFLRGLGAGAPEAIPLPAGLTMVTAHDPNDLASPRTARHLPRFRAAPVPDPEAGDWAAWEALLADADHPAEAGAAAQLNIPPTAGFGTVSASLLGLGPPGRRVWRYADGRPGVAGFRTV